MALYHQLKFPSTFIEYRSVSELGQLRSRPFKSTALGSCLVCLGLNTPLAICSVKILLNFCQTTQTRTPKDSYLHTHKSPNSHISG